MINFTSVLPKDSEGNNMTFSRFLQSKTSEKLIKKQIEGTDKCGLFRRNETGELVLVKYCD